MSMKAVNWALDQSVSGSAKAVLIVISFRFNESSGDCFPGVKRIAKDAGLSRSTVLRALSELQRSGLLQVESRPGSGSGRLTNIYRLPLHLASQARSQTEPLPERGKVSICDHQSLSPERAKSQSERVLRSNHKTNRKANHKLSKERSRRCPRDFTFEGVLDQWLEDKGIDRAFAFDELERFKDHEFNSPKKDWHAAFRNWLRNAMAYRKNRQHTPSLSYSDQLDDALNACPPSNLPMLKDKIHVDIG